MAKTENQQKKEDVFTAYKCAVKELLEERDFPTIKDCIDRALTYTAPCFYVTYHECKRFISLMLRGIQPPLRNPMKIAMYDDIFIKFLKHGYEYDGYKYLKKIINGPAPSFYLEKETFEKIVREMLKIARRKKKW